MTIMTLPVRSCLSLPHRGTAVAAAARRVARS
jgi:hypothetical protein